MKGCFSVRRKNFEKYLDAPRICVVIFFTVIVDIVTELIMEAS